MKSDYESIMLNSQEIEQRYISNSNRCHKQLFLDNNFWNQTFQLENSSNQILLWSQISNLADNQNCCLNKRNQKNFFNSKYHQIDLFKDQSEMNIQLRPKQSTQLIQPICTNLKKNLNQQLLKSSIKLKLTLEQKYIPETKNIVKNYGRSILAFGINNIQLTQKLAIKFNICPIKLVKEMRKHKKKVGSIANLRNLWLDSENSHAKIYRIISFIFLRKHSLRYIFNSNIKNVDYNLKYGKKILEGVKNPEKFYNLKQY